jgi:hypothetical protein
MSTVTTKPIATPLPHMIARTAGIFWLMTIIAGIFGFIAGGRLIVPGEAATTAANVMGHESLYRLAFVASLIATASYLVVTVCIYALFKPVNRLVASLGLAVSLVGCATGAASAVLFLAPLNLLGGSPYLAAFTIEQLQAQALTFLTLSLQVNDIGMVFFALHVFSIGYLIRRSTFLPRFLATLLAVAGLCYLTNSFANFLALPFKAYVLPFVALGGLLGEGALTFWLLVKGVNVQGWNQQVHVAAECCPSPLAVETAARQ